MLDHPKKLRSLRLNVTTLGTSGQVTVLDINQQRIDAWKSDSLPIYEPGLEDIVRECRNRNLFFSTDVGKNLDEADCVFVRHVNLHCVALNCIPIALYWTAPDDSEGAICSYLVQREHAYEEERHRCWQSC